MDSPPNTTDQHDPALESWRRWKASPTPQTLSGVLAEVKPTIDGAVRANPRLNAGIVTGQAKQLAIKAVRSYDPDRGASLHSHVYNHLRPLVYRAAGLTSIMPRSRYKIEEVAKMRAAQKDFIEENNREPSDDELMDSMGISPHRFKTLTRMSRSEVPESALEYLPGTDDEEPEHENPHIDYVYHDLDPISQRIMDLRTGRNGNRIHSIEETCAKTGLSPGAVSQRARAIAEKLKGGLHLSET